MNKFKNRKRIMYFEDEPFEKVKYISRNKKLFMFNYKSHIVYFKTFKYAKKYKEVYFKMNEQNADNNLYNYEYLNIIKDTDKNLIINVKYNGYIKTCFNNGKKSYRVFKEYGKKIYMDDYFKTLEEAKKYRDARIKQFNRDILNNIDIKFKQPKQRYYCSSCKLFYSFTEINYLCDYCKPKSKYKRKTKEYEIKLFLENNNYVFEYNKKCNLNSNCSRYFPDFLFDCNTFFLIVECDENSHKFYDSKCELVRMNNISFSLGLPCVFIRYNPDKKNIKKNVKMRILKSYIDYYLSMKECNNEIIYLFYE